jgi:hypothetical protein
MRLPTSRFGRKYFQVFGTPPGPALLAGHLNQVVIEM